MTIPRRVIALTAVIVGALATPLGGSMVGRACAANEMHVAIVVDAGDGRAVSAVCVPASSGESGSSLLDARASMLGTPKPVYSGAGLLCSIDGVPQSGCGKKNSDGTYSYWSYWHGERGSWSYATGGPAAWRVSTGVVEGWRFQAHGSALPTDPPPRGPANAARICVPPPPPTTARPTPPTTSPPVTTSAGLPSSTTAPEGGMHTSGTGPTPGTGTAKPTTPTTRPQSGAPTPSTARGDTTTTGPTGRSSSTATSIALTAGGIASGPVSHSSGGAPVGLIVGVLFVVAIGGGGGLIAQRRGRAGA